MFPTPHKVTHRTRVKVGENAAGQAITEPHDTVRSVTSLRKRVNQPGATATLAGRVVIEYSMVTPDPDWAHGSTVIDWLGREFTVHGEVEDYNGGPFGFRPGYIVILHAVKDEGVLDVVPTP